MVTANYLQITVYFFLLWCVIVPVIIIGCSLQGTRFPPDFKLHLIDSTKLALNHFIPVIFKVVFFKMSKSLQAAISERILYTGIICCHFVFQAQEMKTLSFNISSWHTETRSRKCILNKKDCWFWWEESEHWFLE